MSTRVIALAGLVIVCVSAASAAYADHPFLYTSPVAVLGRRANLGFRMPIVEVGGTLPFTFAAGMKATGFSRGVELTDCCYESGTGEVEVKGYEVGPQFALVFEKNEEGDGIESYDLRLGTYLSRAVKKLPPGAIDCGTEAIKSSACYSMGDTSSIQGVSFELMGSTQMPIGERFLGRGGTGWIIEPHEDRHYVPHLLVEISFGMKL